MHVLVFVKKSSVFSTDSFTNEKNKHKQNNGGYTDSQSAMQLANWKSRACLNNLSREFILKGKMNKHNLNTRCNFKKEVSHRDGTGTLIGFIICWPKTKNVNRTKSVLNSAWQLNIRQV